jgi:hypothetical protein
LRRGAVLTFSGLFCLLGLAIVVETALVGGEIGYVFGTLFLLAGALRAYLTFLARGR